MAAILIYGYGLWHLLFKFVDFFVERRNFVGLLGLEIVVCVIAALELGLEPNLFLFEFLEAIWSQLRYLVTGTNN